MEQFSFSYAGFWKRFAAYLIDALLLGVVEVIILLPFLGLVGLGVLDPEMEESFGFIIALVGAYAFAMLIILIIGWLYFALMESSTSQATVGKIVLSIKVTDVHGNRISFGRATGRYFGRFLSGLFLGLGYVMAAFTQQKQALHDIIAGTLVVNR
jgi:uncharacterized RDD family membrane protein YckC